MITDLKVSQLRNIEQLAIKPSTCNLFIGDNGTGKTSLLESLFLLSRGKSFRTHQPKRYIKHHQPASTVFAKFHEHTTLAIQKQQDATTLLKMNGDLIKTQSQLTKHMPTLLIDPSSMEILEQGSSSRRQLLDWLAFHVKPEFYTQWLAYQRILKQRNSLLKQIKHLNNSHKQQIESWDIGLSSHAQLIHHYREQVFDIWSENFTLCIEKLLPKYKNQISIHYQAGYDVSRPLNEILFDKLSQDLYQGYTRNGCHRADIQVYWHNQNDDGSEKKIKDLATNVLSRGEKKLLITALKLSQLPLLQSQSDPPLSGSLIDNPDESQRYSEPVILLDDITAELDTHAIHILLQNLAQLSCQVFITSLTTDVLPIIKMYWDNYKMFHVKQGTIVEDV